MGITLSCLFTFGVILHFVFVGEEVGGGINCLSIVCKLVKYLYSFTICGHEFNILHCNGVSYVKEYNQSFILCIL